MYENTALTFIGRVLFLLAIITLLQLISSAPSNPSLSALPVILVVSFDGFRHSYLSPSLTPILSKLTSIGSTVPYLIPSFPPKTFPNHQSIVTGLYTDSHGITDNIFYDTLYGRTLDGKTEDPGFWNYDKNVLPLWIRNEQQGGVSGCLMWPGCSHGYGEHNDLLPSYYYPGYNKSVSFESRVDTVITWMTKPQRPANLLFLYYHEPDSTGHRYGPHAQQTLDQVGRVDQLVGVLINKLEDAGIYDNINLLFLSDHGMEEVTSDREIDLNEFVDRDRLVKAVNGASPVIQLIHKSGMKQELYDALLTGSRTRNFTVFDQMELCGEPYFYCRADRRIHDRVTLADPGYAFKKVLLNKKKGKNSTAYGSHGYINTAKSMRVFLISKGPAFKEGYKTPQPVKNVDVVPLLSKVLGLVDVPSNGSLSRIEGMIKD